MGEIPKSHTKIKTLSIVNFTGSCHPNRVGMIKFETPLSIRTLVLIPMSSKPVIVKQDGKLDFATAGWVELEESRV